MEIFTDKPVIANIDGEIIVNDYFFVDTSASKINVVNNNRVINLIRKLKK